MVPDYTIWSTSDNFQDKYSFISYSTTFTIFDKKGGKYGGYATILFTLPPI